jgi:hypothetical protein
MHAGTTQVEQHSDRDKNIAFPINTSSFAAALCTVRSQTRARPGS